MKYINKLVSLLLLLSIVGCVKQEFDEPPLGGEPVNITANQTIAALKAMHVIDQRETITEDWIIEGEVVMDDRSGNYYKSIVIQDETGGLDIKFNDGFLSADYPVGRKLYINVKGMVLTDYNELTQLIGSVLTSGSVVEEIGISAAQRQTAIFKGPIAAQKLEPAVRTISTLTNADVGTLIRLTNVEFTSQDAGVSFSEPSNQLTLNRNLQDCTGKQILVRSSGYADFAASLTPTGKGDFVAVLSKYRNDYQLYIRDLEDVAGMTGDRCGTGGVGNDLNQIDISVVRSSFNGTIGAGPADSKIKGVVISSVADGNITLKNMVIQDGTAGIAVRFADNHSFAVGDQVEINVSGVEVSEYNGLLQLNNVPNTLASKVGTATANVRTATVQEILTNANTWESTLVKIVDAELSGASTFSGTVTVGDGTGTIPMYTRPAAGFAGDAAPTGKVVVTAILGDFNGAQLNMRNRTDVVGGTIGGGGTDPVGTLNEDFEGQTNNEAITINKWTNVATSGTRTWLAKLFSGNTYAQATSYNSTDSAEDMWLITPELDLSTQRTLTFESAKAFWTHNGLTVWVSTDFDGTNVEDATWQPLAATLAMQNDADHEFIPSGDVALPIAAKAFVAFRYQGTASANTGTYRIDNVVVK